MVNVDVLWRKVMLVRCGKLDFENQNGQIKLRNPI